MCSSLSKHESVFTYNKEGEGGRLRRDIMGGKKKDGFSGTRIVGGCEGGLRHVI